MEMEDAVVDVNLCQNSAAVVDLWTMQMMMVMVARMNEGGGYLPPTLCSHKSGKELMGNAVPSACARPFLGNASSFLWLSPEPSSPEVAPSQTWPS